MSCPVSETHHRSLTNTEKFLLAVHKSGECWLWMGATNDLGYGATKHNGNTWYAHRVSYTLFFGDIPNGMQVLHRCDTPSCVRPSHLFMGDQKANMSDMDSKGRRRSLGGDDNPNSKLTWAQVDEIRTRYVPGSGKLLAKEFGVRQTTISKIIRRESWRKA
jgi:hypothetical protein